MKTMSSEQRLHPVSIAFELGRHLPRLLLPLILLIVATPGPGASRAAVLYIAAAFVAVTVITSIVRYLRFRYRYDEAELVIRSGLLFRNVRSIPYVRIQNLDAAQNPLHRLFGVAVVHVQTGGSAEPEATLRVLPTSALDEMRTRVLRAGGRAHSRPLLDADATPGSDASLQADPLLDHDATPAVGSSSAAHAMSDGATSHGERHERRTLLVLRPRDLILAGFIENRGMVLIVGALALLEQAGASRRLIERVFEAEDAALAGLAARWLGGTEVPVVLGALYAIGALLVILLFIRLLSTVWAVVRLYDFRLDRVGDELQTEYGLFTRVSATIPLRRVQTVITRNRVLHRLLGRHEVLVETAGGAVMETGARQREPVAPILRAEQLPALLHELHPGLEHSSFEWKPVHPRAFGRMLRASLAWPVLLSVGAWFVVQEWALAIFAVLLAAATFHARLRAGHLAWALTRDSVVVRDGALTRVTRIARFNRVQVLALDRNPFDMRTGMSTVRADTAGARGGVVIPYLPQPTAEALRLELAARAAATAFTW
jgi:putative membrane protein